MIPILQLRSKTVTQHKLHGDSMRSTHACLFPEFPGGQAHSPHPHPGAWHTADAQWLQAKVGFTSCTGNPSGQGGDLLYHQIPCAQRCACLTEVAQPTGQGGRNFSWSGSPSFWACLCSSLSLLLRLITSTQYWRLRRRPRPPGQP